ncbi:MAG: glycosyltransferase [Bacilli bacterium]
MKKITILALHLGIGGIEKAITNLANSLVDNYEVTIISTYKIYDKPVFDIDKRVNIIYLIQDLKPNKKEFLYNLKHFNIIETIKQGILSTKIIIKKRNLMIKSIKECSSDFIISTRDIHNLWLGKYGDKKSTRIGWEHNHHNNNIKYINKVLKSVKKLDYFVLVSKSLEKFYSEKLNQSECKTVYIPNMIEEIPQYQSSLEEKNIISIGRLSKEKGYLDLIDVFENVNKICPDWHLNIIGDGDQHQLIQNKIEKLNLTNSVTLHGFKNKNEIDKLLLKSSVYVMTSFTESFGIVLLEAFSFGIPTVAFDSAIGATEIINNNWNGYLIENRDKEKMTRKIIELINNINRRIIMGDNGYKKCNNFTREIIINYWQQLLEKGE